jgi:ABC-type multidrug transport system ATPase subunit
MTAAIHAVGLRKSYDEAVQALDGVDLEVRRGELLALLGPNGAGKTTLVEILEGHRSRDGGDVRVLGFDPARRERALRARIGIVLQEDGLDPAITVGEAIELYSAAYPRPRPAGESPSWWASTAAATPASRRSRAVSGAGSTSRWASPAIPTCCSSTSRRPASTRRRAASRGS